MFDVEVLIPLARWITVARLRSLRPNEVIKDEQVPVLLRELRQPTFVPIDDGFWKKELRNMHYCILFFPLANEQQDELPDLLRRLLNQPEFRTKAARMGKVARVSKVQIEYWFVGEEKLEKLEWQK